MSDTKFTPAPWAVVKNIIGFYEVVTRRSGHDGDWIPSLCDASISSGIGYHTDNATAGKSEANANLIAAAPDMYADIEHDIEWLERLARSFVVGSYELRSIRNRIDNKRLLLAKARGE